MKAKPSIEKFHLNVQKTFAGWVLEHASEHVGKTAPLVEALDQALRGTWSALVAAEAPLHNKQLKFNAAGRGWSSEPKSLSDIETLIPEHSSAHQRLELRSQVQQLSDIWNQIAATIPGLRLGRLTVEPRCTWFQPRFLYRPAQESDGVEVRFNARSYAALLVLSELTPDPGTKSYIGRITTLTPYYDTLRNYYVRGDKLVDACRHLLVDSFVDLIAGSGDGPAKIEKYVIADVRRSKAAEGQKEKVLRASDLCEPLAAVLERLGLPAP